jgi:hypothetical protein
MKIYQYQTHDEYVAAQIEANVRKINNIWVDRATVKQINQRQPTAKNILCHGTRNAAEQKFFKEFYPNATIIGTEISHTATKFPMTVQWDFHNENCEWVGLFDIVYSNAIDHSYDPTQVLTTWRNQLNVNGILYIEHGYTETDNYSRPSDPLEIHDEEIRYLINNLDMVLCEVFETTGIKGRCPSRVYIIKKRN